jgi:hypothetical protein
MTQTLTAAPTPPTTARETFAPAIAPVVQTPAQERGSIVAQITAKAKSAPWMLLLLAPIGAAPLYVSYETVSYGFGTALASIPILGAAAFLLTAILACVFFLDEGD